MDAQQILDAVGVGESTDWEFKSAQGGLPRSVWETYSAMANTDGGTIVLGVEQQDDQFVVIGLPDAAQRLTDLWTQVRNPELVNTCILANDHVQFATVDGNTVLVVSVPRATRQQRPIYLRGNPVGSTYRRNSEGDFRCTEDEVRRMMAEQTGQSLDAAILDGYGLDDLDAETLRQFRQAWASRSPGHRWLTHEDQRLLECLGAYRRDTQTDRAGLTIAGLLMFGRSEAIVRPEGVPGFMLDYREPLPHGPTDRWVHRITEDGQWECNLFQFVRRVLPRLIADVPVRFNLDAGMVRGDETEAHVAMREALTNTLIHADYGGRGGVVIEKHPERLQFSNPGTLLISREQLYRGGVSECRNRALQTMFGFLGYGERAGSGFTSIMRGWRSQNWLVPTIEETMAPNRVQLSMPMISLLPDASLARLAELYGDDMHALSPLEVQALATAELEGQISNSRMQQISVEHPADLTALLQGLVGKGMLRQEGQKRGTTYRLVEPTLPVELTDEELAPLLEAATAGGNMSREEGRIRELVLRLCNGQYLSASQIAELTERSVANVEARFLRPMVDAGLLAVEHRNSPEGQQRFYATVSP